MFINVLALPWWCSALFPTEALAGEGEGLINIYCISVPGCACLQALLAVAKETKLNIG